MAIPMIPYGVSCAQWMARTYRTLPLQRVLRTIRPWSKPRRRKEKIRRIYGLDK